MKRILFLAGLLLCTSNLLHAQNFIIFLHNQFVEEKGPDGVHPQYGRMEYKKIIDAFKKEHFSVINEIRPAGTDPKEYAVHAKRAVDSLIHLGIPESQITIVGASKGGTIAMYISAMEKRKGLNFVFIASCFNGIEDNKDINFYGNILSIYEKTDDIGRSCTLKRNKAGDNVVHYKEIELNTGLKHGFQFKASPLWINPTIAWAHREYDSK